MVGGVQGGKVDHVGTLVVQQGVEGHTVSPRGREVLKKGGCLLHSGKLRVYSSFCHSSNNLLGPKLKKVAYTRPSVFAKLSKLLAFNISTSLTIIENNFLRVCESLS